MTAAPTTTRTATPSSGVVRLGPRSAATIAVTSLLGLAMFVWPLLLTPTPGVGHVSDAPFVFVLVLPLLVGVVLAELADGGMDTRALALLGVLSAVGAALRPLGAGTGGVELVFFLLILAGRAMGPGFGFVLGATTMFASALLTGGVGPWLPFQMLAACWVGLGAGLLPGRAWRGRRELVLLVAYGVVTGLLFGALMNLWFWPFAVGPDTAVSFVPGDAVVDNLRRFAAFSLASSAAGWDVGRALTNAAAIMLLGTPVLGVLRRALRRVVFTPPVS